MTLKERLQRHMLKTHGWVPKGNLLRLVAQYTKYTPDNASRRLRELENEGVLEVTYRKNHAHYRSLKESPPTPTVKVITHPDGSQTAQLV